MLGNHLTWKMHMLAGSDKAIHAGAPQPAKGGTRGSGNIDNPNPQPHTLNHSIGRGWQQGHQATKPPGHEATNERRAGVGRRTGLGPTHGTNRPEIVNPGAIWCVFRGRGRCIRPGERGRARNRHVLG